jgi:NAD-dependent histone deacetylase SIR2
LNIGSKKKSTPDCKTVDKERVQAGKRSHGVGVLLPKILLYGAGPDESVIGDILEGELFQEVDAVIIAGTGGTASQCGLTKSDPRRDLNLF